MPTISAPALPLPGGFARSEWERIRHMSPAVRDTVIRMRAVIRTSTLRLKQARAWLDDRNGVTPGSGIE